MTKQKSHHLLEMLAEVPDFRKVSRQWKCL